MNKHAFGKWSIPWDAEMIAKRINGVEWEWRGEIHIILAEVYADTINRIKSGELDYVMMLSQPTLSNREIVRRADLYSSEQPSIDSVCSENPGYITVVNVELADTLESGKSLIDEGLNPAVLAMASRQDEALEEVKYGVFGQEKDILRRTDLSWYIAPYSSEAVNYGCNKARDGYPLDRNFGGIYSPSVIVFRGKQEEGFPLLDEPYMVDVISVAGMFSPKTDCSDRIIPELVLGVKNKIRTIYRSALHHGKDSLVLGALGCGALRNPPLHTALIFREVLEESEFVGRFKKIVFAMKKYQNYEMFKSAFFGYSK